MLLYKLSAELATLVDGHATSQNTRKSGKTTDQRKSVGHGRRQFFVKAC